MEEKHQDQQQTSAETLRSCTAHYQELTSQWILSSVHKQQIRMNFLLCVTLSVCFISSVMSCRWIQHKFLNHHRVSLDLIEKMGEKMIEGHESLNPIPYQLLSSHRTVEPEKQLLFVIQTLMEITSLFEESESAPWDHKIKDNFINIIHEEIRGLQSCGAFKIKRNKKLHLYFRRLRQMTESKTEKAAHGWEIVRKRLLSLMRQLEFFTIHD